MITMTGTGPPAESSRVLEKMDPHSCSTSRSDSPVESSERKKKHKRKDKEKKDKVRNVMKLLSLVQPVPWWDIQPGLYTFIFPLIGPRQGI